MRHKYDLILRRAVRSKVSVENGIPLHS